MIFSLQAEVEFHSKKKTTYVSIGNNNQTIVTHLLGKKKLIKCIFFSIFYVLSNITLLSRFDYWTRIV